MILLLRLCAAWRVRGVRGVRERERKEGRNYEEVVERKYLLLRLKKMRVFVMDVVILHSLFRKASSFIFFYLLIH